MDDPKWDLPEWLLTALLKLRSAEQSWIVALLALLGFILMASGCYSRTVRCTAPGAGGAVLFEQEWSERTLLKPDGWPDVLMSTPRTQTRESSDAEPQIEPPKRQEA